MECRADFGDEVRAVGALSVESIGKRRFLGVALSRDVKAFPPDAADQTRTKHCRRRPFGLEGELKSDSRRKSRLNVY